MVCVNTALGVIFKICVFKELTETAFLGDEEGFSLYLRVLKIFIASRKARLGRCTCSICDGVTQQKKSFGERRK